MINAKRLAAQRCIQESLLPLLQSSSSATTTSPLVIGIGSGSTIVYAIECLAEFMNSNAASTHLKQQLRCIPTSFQSRQELLKFGLPIGSLEEHPEILWTVDGADEFDSQLNLIKGGGGCHLQEKLVAFNSKHLNIICDYRKISTTLGQNWLNGIPLEVHPLAYRPIQHHLRHNFACTTAELRMAKSKAGPCVTDNGNFILDAVFERGEMVDPRSLNERLCAIPGVLETGLFVGMTEAVYVGMEDGSVQVFKRESASSSSS